MSEQAARYQRSFSGMVGAMIVLVLVVVAFVVFRGINREDATVEVEAVDYRGPTEYARESADFPVLAPEQLPAGWKATSVRFEQGRDQTWHLGVLTQDEKYVGLEQADRSVGDMLAAFVGEETEEAGETEVAGTTWQVYRDAEDDDLALVSESPEVVTVLVGSVTEETLTAYAGLLS